MLIQFFEKELSKVQVCFNRIYRHQTVYNKALQCTMILAIIHLEILCKKIARAPTGNLNRKDKARFIQTRDKLLNIFERIENEERRYHASQDKVKYRCQRRCVPSVRQSLPDHLAQGRRRF